MYRKLIPMLALLIATVTLQAAEPPAGSWKLTLRLGERPIMFLLAFSQSEGKWVGDIVDATAQFKAEPKIDSITVNDQSIKFTMALEKQPFLSFDGMVAKDKKKITGSLSVAGGQLELLELRPSQLKKLTDPFELTKETLAQSEDPQTVFDTSMAILSQAAAKKMKPEDVRSMLDRASKLSASYGSRWERTSALKFASVLVDQAGYEDIALSQARMAERLLAETDTATVRMEVLEMLVRALTKANKPEDAKGYQTQIQRLEARDYLDYSKTAPPFKVEEFKGRKAKSDRVAVVEIFTSSEAMQAVAFEYARDGLVKAYKPSDLIVLTYHMNIPGGTDMLANKGSMDRVEFYQSGVSQGVLSFVDGQRAVKTQQQTSAESSQAVYTALKEKIDEDLEKPAGVQIKLSVTPSEKDLTGKVSISELTKPGEQTFLRFAIVESRIRFASNNGIRYHHNIVRAMPGGKGIVLKDKTADHTIPIKLDEIRDGIVKFLDQSLLEGEPVRGDRPLAFKNLKLVAFVQNDSTGEILNAAQVDLPTKTP